MQIVDDIKPIRAQPCSALKSLRNSDLIAKEHLGGVTFPASVATGGDHEPTSVVDVELGDGSGAVTWDNEERNSRMARCLLGSQVVQT